jgi:hypothetical protein
MVKATLNIDAIADASIPLIKLQESVATEYDENIYIDEDGTAVEDKPLNGKTFCIDNMNIAHNRNMIFKDGYLDAQNGISDKSIPLSKLDGSLDLSWEYVTESKLMIMEFLIVFGLILIIIAMVVKFTTSFKVNENSTCPSNDAKLAKENKINFYVFLVLGIILVITGIILSVIL